MTLMEFCIIVKVMEVRKSDMLNINGMCLKYSHMGLFDSDSDWIHPTVTVSTFEVIYVVEGEVHMREGDRTYDLVKGDMLLLEPHIEHGGTAVSHKRTSFYWLHYDCSDPGALAFPKQSVPDPVATLRTLGELMHLQQASPVLAELTLARFLFECGRETEYGDKRIYEVAAYIRAHSRDALTVADLAEHFGYSADHISRMMKREFGYDAKTAIVKGRLAYIESCLIHSTRSIKEIAATCGFEDENAFVKFYKYHTDKTPTMFRNQYFHMRMNSK